jgi:hypothetical protein
MGTSQYRIEVEGELDPTSSERFADVHVQAGGGRTVLNTDLIDQAGLDGILDRLRSLGVALVALERRSEGESPQAG